MMKKLLNSAIANIVTYQWFADHLFADAEGGYSPLINHAILLNLVQ